MNEDPAKPQAAVTDLLVAWRGGDLAAQDELFERVYVELRRIAGAQVRMQSATMAPTELVHETYLKLLGSASVHAVDRGHFFSLAARAMRHILVDAARRRHALKRGGERSPVDLDMAMVVDTRTDEGLDLLALDQALEHLGKLNPRLVQIVEMRHFAGLSVEETAEQLGLSERTVKRDWRTARAHLYDRLSANHGTGLRDQSSAPGSGSG